MPLSNILLGDPISICRVHCGCLWLLGGLIPLLAESRAGLYSKSSICPIEWVALSGVKAQSTSGADSWGISFAALQSNGKVFVCAIFVSAATCKRTCQLLVTQSESNWNIQKWQARTVTEGSNVDFGTNRESHTLQGKIAINSDGGYDREASGHAHMSTPNHTMRIWIYKLSCLHSHRCLQTTFRHHLQLLWPSLALSGTWFTLQKTFRNSGQIQGIFWHFCLSAWCTSCHSAHNLAIFKQISGNSQALCRFGGHLWATFQGVMHASDIRPSKQL